MASKAKKQLAAVESGSAPEAPLEEGRRENDFYPTPPHFCLALVQAVRQMGIEPKTIIEPSAGSGTFLTAIRAVYPEVPLYACELYPENAKAALDAAVAATGARLKVGDWLEVSKTMPRAAGRLIIGNPPFKDAEAHILASLRALEIGDHLAFFLPMNFLAGRARQDRFWLKVEIGAMPLSDLWAIKPLAQRPRFTGSANSAQFDYGLFIWKRGHGEGSCKLMLPALCVEKAGE